MITPRVVVVGAGVGGLAAAHHLQDLAASRAFPLEVVVLESSERAGGALGTEAHDGALLERGPDSLVTHKGAGVGLCRRLGLGDRLESLPAGGSDVLHRGRLVPIPAGFALLAPTRRWPLVSSPLLSWRGKVRALVEPRVPPSGQEDESVASFVRRRFGPELYERLAEPVVGAIHMADLERLSLAATLPRFHALERQRGSLTGGRRHAALGPAREPADGKAPPPVAALRGGLGVLLDALLERLPPVALRLKSPVESLKRDEKGFRLEIGDGTSLWADAVLIATPAHAAATLVGDLDAPLAQLLGRIPYASCVTVNLSWPRRAAQERRRARQGFFVPRGAGLPLVAAGFVDVKFPARVPAGQKVVRGFFGGALHPEISDLSDGDLTALATGILGPLLGERRAPNWSRIFRHPLAMPQPEVGHLALTARLRDRLSHQPGLELAGGAVGAYGLPDAIAAAEAAVEGLFAQLSRSPEIVQK